MNRKVPINIALIAGGISKERVISLSSADRLIEHFKKLCYNIFVFDIVTKDDWWYVKDHKILKIQYGHEWEYKKEYKLDLSSFSLKIENNIPILFDYVYVIVHNHPAEDGVIQFELENSKIPYSCSNSLTSASTMCKFSAKRFIERYNIVDTPKYLFLNKKNLILVNKSQLTENISNILQFPIIIKPNNEGSSIGTTIIRNIPRDNSLFDVIEKVSSYDSQGEVLIEEFISNKREFTVGAIKFENEIFILPITEIGSHENNEILSYEEKYSSSNKPEITPANLDSQIYQQIIEISKKLYLLFDCNGIIRIDYLLSNNIIYFLELNTIPGMTKTSFVPQQIEALNEKDFQLLNIDIQNGKISGFLNKIIQNLLII